MQNNALCYCDDDFLYQYLFYAGNQQPAISTTTTWTNQLRAR